MYSRPFSSERHVYIASVSVRVRRENWARAKKKGMKGEGEGKKETLGAFFKIVGFAGKRFLLSPPASFFFFARAQFLRFERHLGPAWRIVLDLMLGRWDLGFTCTVETTAQTQQTLYFCFVQHFRLWRNVLFAVYLA